MPTNNEKKAYSELMNELRKIQKALEKCYSTETFNPLSERYLSLNFTNEEVLTYTTSNQGELLKLRTLRGAVDSLITSKKRFYGTNSVAPTSVLPQTLTTPSSTPNKATEEAPKVLEDEPKENARLEKPASTESEIVEDHPEIDADFTETPLVVSSNQVLDENPLDNLETIPTAAVSVEPEQNLEQQEANPSVDDERDPIKPVQNTTLADSESTKDDLRAEKLASINPTWKKIQNKCAEFKKNYPLDSIDDISKPYGAIYQFAREFENQKNAYIDGRSDLKTFKTNLTNSVNNYSQGVLRDHRGWKELVVNILFFIATVGVGYAAAALFTQRVNPIQLDTNSVKLMNEAKDSVIAL